MTEINPFSRSEIKKSIEINDNYTESASENDYPIPEFQSFNSIDSSYPESPKKRFPNFKYFFSGIISGTNNHRKIDMWYM